MDYSSDNIYTSGVASWVAKSSLYPQIDSSKSWRFIYNFILLIFMALRKLNETDASLEVHSHKNCGDKIRKRGRKTSAYTYAAHFSVNDICHVLPGHMAVSAACLFQNSK